MSHPKQNDTDGSIHTRDDGHEEKHHPAHSSAHVSPARRIYRRVQRRDKEKQHPQPSSAHVSPAMRIYRHALEAIFAVLELGDLSQLLAVSREWSAAVRSMKPILASVQRDEFHWIWTGNVSSALPPIAGIVASPLMRHLAAIEIDHIRQWSALDNASLGLLAQHAPNLQSLWCMLTLTPNEPLVLPPKITSLNLQLDDTDAAVNGVLTILAALPSLTRLRLRVLAFDKENSVELHLLAGCRSLIDLALENVRGCAPTLSDTQLDQIRSCFGHLHRICLGWMAPDHLARLLQPPVTARWQDIGSIVAESGTGATLLTLPSLATLKLSYEENTPHVDFLSQLPLLTTLDLSCDKWGNGSEWSISADALLASLLLCNCITELCLTCGFTSAHWSALFDKLSLKKLTIRGVGIKTLQCFASGPITQSLEELTLEELILPPSEISHLSGLRRLRALNLDRCFSPHLDDATVDSLSPPTAHLPMLRHFACMWNSDDDPDLDADSGVGRRGPSFEWMQARLTQ